MMRAAMSTLLVCALVWPVAAQPDAPAKPPASGTGVNAPGTNASAGPPAAPIKRYGVCHAMCVGINEYGGDGGASLARGNLKAAENDASAIATALTDYGFTQAQTRLLLGKDAGRDDILKGFRFLASTAGPDDVVVFFYAGHGISYTFDRGTETERRRGYLMPERIDDAPPKQPDDDWFRKNLVPMEELADIARKSKARHTLLMLDCCFSGLVAGATGRGSDEAFNDYAELMAQPSCLAITAGTDREKANELPDAKHGVLTQAILGTLAQRREKADPFSANEFFIDVRRGVRAQLSSAVNESGQALVDSQSPQLLTLKQNKGELVWLPGGDVAAGKIASRKPPPRKVISKKELASRAGEIDAAGSQARAKNQDLSNDQQWKKQREEIEEQAAQGDPNAIQLLAIMKTHGVGTTKDEDGAYDLVKDASATGDPDANILLSTWLRTGIGTVPPNPRASERVAAQINATGAVFQLVQTGASGQSMTAQDVLGGLIVGQIGAGDAGGPNGKSPRGVLQGTWLEGIFSGSTRGDASTVSGAMNEIERQGQRLRAHYMEMAGRTDKDNRRAIISDWKEAVERLQTLAKGTDREGVVSSAAAATRKELSNLYGSTQTKGAFEKALAAAEEQVKKLRAIVGNDPAKDPSPK